MLIDLLFDVKRVSNHMPRLTTALSTYVVNTTFVFSKTQKLASQWIILKATQKSDLLSPDLLLHNRLSHWLMANYKTVIGLS